VLKGKIAIKGGRDNDDSRDDRQKWGPIGRPKKAGGKKRTKRKGEKNLKVTLYLWKKGGGLKAWQTRAKKEETEERVKREGREKTICRRIRKVV